MRCDVVIVGGGCGGLWLLHECLSRNHSAVLLEHSSQLGRFASTHGQNRLHTGALYAAVAGGKYSNLVKASVAGFDDLRAFSAAHVPDAIKPGPGCLYVYPEDGFSEAVINASTLPEARLRPLSSEEINSADFDDVRRLVPEIKNALLSPERPFDSELLMRAVLKRSVELGAQFLQTSANFSQLELLNKGERWSVREGGREPINAKVVIYAAGVLNASIVETLLPIHNEPTLVSSYKQSINKALITVLHEQVLDRILCIQNIPVLSFVASMPVGGVSSITFQGPARRILDPADTTVPDEPELLNMLGRTLGRYMPGIVQYLPMKAHFYMCQKLENFAHPLNLHQGLGDRHFFWIEPPATPNVFFYTPGKWTIASIAAKQLIGELEKRGTLASAKSSVKPLPKTEIPSVAARPCHDRETHVLSRSERQPIFTNL
jgi:glycine/D-amino acid oxidase-like deaminating enzyme